MTEFGNLKRIDPREIWAHEALNFTPWLAGNLDRLGEALGMDLELQEREAAVGDFSLDLLAKDLGSGHTVIIENQITPTDHDHLGKLLTYAAGFDAEAVVWVAREFREEHRQAIEWLNQKTCQDMNLFAVTIEVLQIDESRPAYHFNLVVGPNEWQKSKRQVATQTASPKGRAYEEFFQEVVDSLRDEHHFTKAQRGHPQNWYLFGSGVGGVFYGLSFARGNRIRAEIYIDTGDRDTNKRLFDRLASARASHEERVGEPLEWERLDDKQACRIALYREGSIEDSPEGRTGHREWGIDRILRLKRVFDAPVRDTMAEAVGA
jgi:hypothetical protein